MPCSNDYILLPTESLTDATPTFVSISLLTILYL